MTTELISLLIFALAFVGTFTSVPALARLSCALHLQDDPTVDALKIHDRPISFLGGAAILIGIIGATLFAYWIGAAPPIILAATALGTVIVWLFGLWDDMHWKQRTRKHLAAKIVSQAVLCILITPLFFFLTAPKVLATISLILGSVLVAVFFATLLNATNMQDGMDGLLAGICLLSAGAFAYLFAFHHSLGNSTALTLSLIMIGALGGFLLWNAHPAESFLGDNGSYLLGFLFAILLLFAIDTRSARGIIGPLFLYGMPLANLCFVIARRVYAGTSPFLGDRYHIYDLIYKKFPCYGGSVLINWILHGIFVLIGLALMY